MKKFSFKTLLILVLALILVFALVACNPKEDEKGGNNEDPIETDPNAIPANDYFNKLWELSKAIGDETITEDDNIYLNAEFGLTLGSRNLSNAETGKKINLGAELEVILDRKDATAQNKSAVKLKLSSGAVNIGTLYFFLNDAHNIYFDFGGKNVKVSLDVKDKDGTVYNDKLGELLTHYLGVTLPFELNKKTFSMNDLLNALLKDTGSKWDLNTLVNSVTGILGVNIKELLDGIISQQELESTLGVKDVYKQDGSLDIAKVLGADMLSDEFKATKVGNKYNVTFAANSSIGGLLAQGLGEIPNFNISFEEEGGAFKDGVMIDLAFKSDRFDIPGGRAYPYIQVAIKHFSFDKADGKTVALAKAKAEYSDQVAISAVEKLSFDGLKVGGQDLPDIELALKAQIDLKNEFETNNTQAEIYLALDDAKLFHATFKGGKLAVKLDRTVKIGDLSPLDVVVSNFGDAIYKKVVEMPSVKDNADVKNAIDAFADSFFVGGAAGEHKAIQDSFKGAEWQGIDIYSLVQDAIAGLFEKAPAPSDDASANSAALNIGGLTSGMQDGYTQFKKVLTSFLPYVSLMQDGKFGFTTTNALSAVSKIVNAIYKLPNAEEKAWDVNGCIKNILALIPAETRESINAALGNLDIELANMPPKEYIAGLMKDTGVVDNLEDVDATAYYVYAILNALNADIQFDITNGFAWKIQLGTTGVKEKAGDPGKYESAPGATVTYTSDITVLDSLNVTHIGPTGSDTTDWFIYEA